MVRIFAVILVCAGLVLAADPVARVTSAGPIELSGNPVPASAVASLPLVTGDEITTSNSAALVVFRDRSRLAVAPNSRVKVEGMAAGIRLRVSKGGAELYASKGSPIRLVNPVVSSQTLKPGLRALALTLLPTTDDARSKTCPPGHEDPDNHDCGLGH
jgi:hypothetical protein